MIHSASVGCLLMGCGDGGGSTTPATTGSTSEQASTDGTGATGGSTSGSTSDSAPTTGAPTSTSTTVTSDTGVETTTGGLDCSYEGLSERTLKISGRAPLWSPAEDGLILWRRLGINESDIVKIDFCGQVLQTLPPSDSGLTLQMAFNAARTRLYNVSLIDPPAKLRWLAYPDGGAWNLLAEREFIFGAAVDPSDKFALYVDFDGGHRIDFAAPAVTVDLAIDPSPSEFALSPDGLFAAYADDSDALVIWDLTTDVKTPAVVDAHFNGYPLKWVGKRVYYIAQLVSPKFQTLLRAYNTETNAIEELREVDSFVRDFAVSDDHAWVSVALEEELRILAL